MTTNSRIEKTLSRALELSRAGNWTRALKAFEAALRSDPENPQIWLEHGKMLQRLGRAADALQSFDRVLTLAPRHADGWYNRGLALTKLGRMQEALDAFQRARQFGSETNQPQAEVSPELFLRGLETDGNPEKEPEGRRSDIYFDSQNGFRFDLRFQWDDGSEDHLIVRQLSGTMVEIASSRYPACSVTIESRRRVPCDYPARALAEDLAAEIAGPMGHKRFYVFPNGLLPAYAVRMPQSKGETIFEDIAVSGRFAYRLKRVTDPQQEPLEEFARRIVVNFHPIGDAGP